MTNRAAFLATVRARLAGGLPAGVLRPVDGPGVPTAEVGYAADLRDPVAAYVRAARAAGAEVHHLDAADALRQLLVRLREDDGVRTAVVSADPEVAEVARLLADAGIARVPAGDRDAVAGADLGVTGAASAVALTGSLVVDSRRAGTRLASLLPPTHLALVDPARIVATPGALLRGLAEHLPAGLPSNLVLITGPSRSADIELQLTPGVHGPRRVIVGLTAPVPAP